MAVTMKLRHPDDPNERLKYVNHQRRCGLKNHRLQTKIYTRWGPYDVDWEPPLGISVLHGINGSGKTQIFKGFREWCGAYYYDLNPYNIKENQRAEDNRTYLRSDGSNLGILLQDLFEDKPLVKDIFIEYYKRVFNGDDLLIRDRPVLDWIEYLGAGSTSFLALFAAFYTVSDKSLIVYENFGYSFHYSIIRDAISILLSLCATKRLRGVVSSLNSEHVMMFPRANTFLLELRDKEKIQPICWKTYVDEHDLVRLWDAYMFSNSQESDLLKKIVLPPVPKKNLDAKNHE